MANTGKLDRSGFLPIEGHEEYAVDPLGRVLSLRGNGLLTHDRQGRVLLNNGGKRVPYFVGELLQKTISGGSGSLAPTRAKLLDRIGQDATLDAALKRLELARRLNGHLLALCRSLQDRLRPHNEKPPAPRSHKRKAREEAEPDPLEGLEELNFESGYAEE